MNNKVTLKIELTQESWDAVCVLIHRGGESPVEWIEGAVAGCVATALASLPERIRLAAGYGVGV